MGDFDQAYTYTSECLKNDPDNATALLNLLSITDKSNVANIQDIVREAIVNNKDNLFNLNYIDAVSSLGESFLKEAVAES